MSQDLVSVVIVSYNNWPDIELAIQSALCQSYQPIEVIVIDNSSTDATAVEIPKRFSNRLRFIRQANVGDAGAYNTGMRMAAGAFVQFLDGDDLLTPCKIEKQMEIFRAEPEVDMVYGDVRYFRGPAGLAQWRDWETSDHDDPLTAFIAAEGNCAGTTISSLWRREALERVGAWDETVFVSDTDYELRAILAGCRFRCCPGIPMGFVRVHPKQMSRNPSKLLRGQEAFWLKALGLLATGPHRRKVEDILARQRFFMALRLGEMKKGEALAKIAEARATSKRAVSLSACVIGMTLVCLPGGRSFARSRFLRPLFQKIARLAGYRLPQ